MLISDSAYEAGMARLRAAAATEHGPLSEQALDLLVLRSSSETSERWGDPGTSGGQHVIACVKKRSGGLP